jgi:hypothetical protein
MPKSRVRLVHNLSNVELDVVALLLVNGHWIANEQNIEGRKQKTHPLGMKRIELTPNREVLNSKVVLSVGHFTCRRCHILLG